MVELWGAIVTATSAPDAIRVALIADVIVCDLASAAAAASSSDCATCTCARRVPTVALVARGIRDARTRAPSFQSYLTKPVDGNDLRAAVLEAARR